MTMADFDLSEVKFGCDDHIPRGENPLCRPHLKIQQLTGGIGAFIFHLLEFSFLQDSDSEEYHVLKWPPGSTGWL
jgi:hypothetical protein